MDLKQTAVLTLKDAFEKYPGQWLAVEVSERDEATGQPTKVKLLAKNADLHMVRDKLSGEFCTFYTGPIPETGTVLML